MGTTQRAVLLLSLLLLSMTMIVISSGTTVRASHGSTLHNVLNRKDVTNFGASAVIESTDPNLHGDQWSYIRTAMVQYSPWRYGEIGWWKKSDGTRKGLIVIENPTYQTFEFAYTAGMNHTFAVYWNSSALTHEFYQDGDHVYSRYLWMSNNDATTVMCGGEVATGVESMGNTRCGNGGSSGLLYRVWTGSYYVWYSWDGYYIYEEDAPSLLL